MPSTSDSTTIFLKGLKPGGTPPLARTDFRWSLPTKGEAGIWTPGEWAPKTPGRAIACRIGYHLIRATDISFWVRDFWDLEVYVAEGRGAEVRHDFDGSQPKVVYREARLVRRVEAWTPTTLRLWLCDVAEHVLPLYEDKHPGDARVRDCIEATRRYLRGEISVDALKQARSSASAYAAYAASAAAAADAAGRKAEQSERSWQSARLLELLDINEAPQ